jgi:hypothetical protein
MLLYDGSEPECFSEAMKNENRKEWNKAMQEEMDSLPKNHTYKLVKLPKGQESSEEQVGLKNQARRAHVTSEIQGQASCERI